jgi:hypothetical protein
VPIRFVRFAIIWLLLLATFWVMEHYLTALWFSASAPRTITPGGNLAASEQATIALFKNVSPSVVHVFARAAPTSSIFSDEQEGVVQSGFRRVGTIERRRHLGDFLPSCKSLRRPRAKSGARADHRVSVGSLEDDLMKASSRPAISPGTGGG